jgi:hypothetical protein
VDDEIAPVFQFDDSRHPGVDLIEFFDQIQKLGRGVDNCLRCFFKPVEEARFCRQDLKGSDVSPQ